MPRGYKHVTLYGKELLHMPKEMPNTNSTRTIQLLLFYDVRVTCNTGTLTALWQMAHLVHSTLRNIVQLFLPTQHAAYPV